jgi:hypothetical protein
MITWTAGKPDVIATAALLAAARHTSYLLSHYIA